MLLVVTLAGSVGLSFVRSHTNLSILDASRTLAERRRAVTLVERDADAMRVQVERLAAIDRIEPEGRRAGLDRPPAEAVMLLAGEAPHDFPAARPLGVPGAGALGRWLSEAARVARVPAAAAAPEEPERVPASETARASRLSAADARTLLDSACRVAGEHGGRGTRCEACRALAAGHAIEH